MQVLHLSHAFRSENVCWRGQTFRGSPVKNPHIFAHPIRSKQPNPTQTQRGMSGPLKLSAQPHPHIRATLKARSSCTGPLPMKACMSPQMDFLLPLLGQPDTGLNHALWEMGFFSLMPCQLCPCSSLLALLLLLYTPPRRVCSVFSVASEGEGFEENNPTPLACFFPCSSTFVALLWTFSGLPMLFLS